MKISVHLRHETESFRLKAWWEGACPWPSLPAVGETIFCCAEMEVGDVYGRNFTLPHMVAGTATRAPRRRGGEVEILIRYGHRDYDDLITHVRDDHGWKVF